MSASCVFCGSTDSLTREHLFGQWVSKIGLNLTPVQHHAGPLNRLPRDMGKQSPYRQTVKSFCASCNSGWMSKLEVTARRVLTPLILGQQGTVALEDQASIAIWAQKTALTAMLLSSEEQRAGGYGLAPSEYRLLYKRQSKMEPLEASQLWIGRYDGEAGFSCVRVTPLAVRIPGLPEPERPQGYAITIVLGELVLHGVRFTAPMLALDLTTELGMPQIWPRHAPAPWPTGQPCREDRLIRFADGNLLRTATEDVEFRAWSPATQLPQSTVADGKIKVPTVCGKHSYYYPKALLAEARRGRYYAFVTACECPVAYLIHMEADGVHCRAAGEPTGVSAMYEDLPGEELILRDHAGEFICKRLPESTERH